MCGWHNYVVTMQVISILPVNFGIFYFSAHNVQACFNQILVTIWTNAPFQLFNVFICLVSLPYSVQHFSILFILSLSVIYFQIYHTQFVP